MFTHEKQVLRCHICPSKKFMSLEEKANHRKQNICKSKCREKICTNCGNRFITITLLEVHKMKAHRSGEQIAEELRISDIPFHLESVTTNMTFTTNMHDFSYGKSHFRQCSGRTISRRTKNHKCTCKTSTGFTCICHVI